MAKTVFDKILDTTTGPKSYTWYQKEVKKMTTPGARALINKGKATLKPKYGVMNLFAYDPKHKATLPYYDKFPLDFATTGCKRWVLRIELSLFAFCTESYISKTTF